MTTKTFRRVLSASSLSGDEVYNLKEEKIGKIEEIMIDVQEGVVAYCVLSFGGLMGMGDKLFAIPWSAFSIDEENKRFILDVSKDTLKNAEGFDKNDWPDLSDLDWQSRNYSYYNVSPYWEE